MHLRKTLGGRSAPREVTQGVYLVVFSTNYAASIRCLDELATIAGCIKERRLSVVTVFYDVDPSEVRCSWYGKHFAKHEEKFRLNLVKLQRLRLARTFVARCRGLVVQNGFTKEARQIQGLKMEVALSYLTDNLRSKLFYCSITKKPPKTMAELLAKSTKYIAFEEVHQAKEGGQSKKEETEPSRSRSEGYRREQRRDDLREDRSRRERR
ncbi:TMV resistance protein N-like [Senna tora]|uniref:ADP-ribosyl cyclase/cyclic ADP-ribose hydrolase n=1 Tax=Senna tora TaxID=362788 RepID=A0A834SUB2_9FABA|nr:TMV resistance protein N-like [Senna tora]